MRLRQLAASFRRWIKPGTVIAGEQFPSGGHSEAPDLASADGIMFLCPKCFAANNGPIGTHRVICWFVGRVADDVRPNPGRWTPSGSGLDDLTFVPGQPPRAVSVATLGGCGWHGFVTKGDAA